MIKASDIWVVAAIILIVIGLLSAGYEKGYRKGGDNMRDTILCIAARTSGPALEGDARKVCARIDSPVTTPLEGRQQ